MSDSEPHPSFGPWELASATSSWYLATTASLVTLAATTSLLTLTAVATTTSLFPLITVAPNVYNLDEFFSDEEVKN